MIVCYLGYGGNRIRAENLFSLIKGRGHHLVIISEWEPNSQYSDIEYVKWENWREAYQKADVVIAPQDVSLQPYKSWIKVIQAFAFGKPVIASPLEEYKKLIIPGENGWIAYDYEDWDWCLNQISMKGVRERMSECALETFLRVSEELKMKWDDVLQLAKNVNAAEAEKRKELISKFVGGRKPKKFRITFVYDTIHTDSSRNCNLISVDDCEYISYADHFFHAFSKIKYADLGMELEVRYIPYDALRLVQDVSDLYIFFEYDPRHYSLPHGSFHPRAVYYWDVHNHPFSAFVGNAACFDYVFMTSKQDAERLRDIFRGTGKVVEWMPEAANQFLLPPVDDLDHSADLCFIGQLDSHNISTNGYTRSDFINRLRGEFGSNFYIATGGVYGKEYYKILRKAKIVFDRSIGANIGTRLFEAMCAGCVCVKNHLEPWTGIGELVNPGTHFIEYIPNDPDAAFKTVRSLLRDELGILSEISRNAQLQSRYHTYYARARRMLDIVLKKSIEPFISERYVYAEYKNVSEPYVEIGENIDFQEVKLSEADKAYLLVKETREAPPTSVGPNLGPATKGGVVKSVERVPGKYQVTMIVPTVANQLTHRHLPRYLIEMLAGMYETRKELKLVEYDIDVELNVILVVSDAPWENVEAEDSDLMGKLCTEGIGVELVFEKERKLFTEAINIGLKMVEQKLSYRTSDFVLIANDDLIFRCGAIPMMIANFNQYDDLVLLNPMSNCDQGWLHNESYVTENRVRLVPEMTYGGVDVDDVLGFCGKIPDRTGVKKVEHVAFYFTMIRNKYIQEMGFLDESMKLTCSDFEYCDRVRNGGYTVAWTPEVFVYHYGALQRKALETKDKEKYQELDVKDRDNLSLRKHQQTVVFYSGPSWEQWTPENIDNGGIGGSETCQIHVMKQLAALGYKVLSFSDCPNHGEIYDGVTYLKHDTFVKYCADQDVSEQILVSVRQPIAFGHPGISKFKKLILWSHDITYGRQLAGYTDNKKITFVKVSPWHKNFWVSNNIAPADQIVIIPDGIDMSRFTETKPKQVGFSKDDKNIYIYSSSADRGLDILLTIWKDYIEEFRNDELHIFYGVYNLKKYIDQYRDEEKREWYNKLQPLLNQHNVFDHGRVGQQELANWWNKSYMWAYPTNFYETFCITALEACASYSRVLTTTRAALETTIGNRGILVGEDINNSETYNKFVSTMYGLRRGQIGYPHVLDSAREWAWEHSWWKVVKQYWIPLLEQ